MAKKPRPGFKAVARGTARRQGVSEKKASAELAAGTRKGGAAVRKANPRLNHVRGK